MVGYGFYHNGSVTGPDGTEQAGIADRIAAGGVLSEDLFEHFSGEVRYLYQGGHPFISMPGFRTDMDGETHTVTYDVLFHFRALSRNPTTCPKGQLSQRGGRWLA